MGDRWGFGPIFGAEWQAGARRLQWYAVRTTLVLGLLVGLTWIWWLRLAGRPAPTIRVQALLSSEFHAAILLVELIVVLALVPVLTAGVLALERERGNLMLLALTDVSDAEIVLGKLAGRLLPTLSMVLATVPILAAATLLGGIEPMAVGCGFVLIVMTVLLSSAITLAFSNRGLRTHEVILASLGVKAVWLLLLPAWTLFGTIRRWGPVPIGLRPLSPFELLPQDFGPLQERGVLPYVQYAGVALAVSLVLIAATIRTVRRSILADLDHPPTASRRRRSRNASRILDRNPVAWYERHRKQTSRGVRTLVTAYLLVGLGMGGVSIWDIRNPVLGNELGWFGSYVAGFAVAFGLPLILLTAATSLGDERARGSLDVLLATPIPGRAIVGSKWWSAFRQVGWLLPVPSLIVAAQAGASGRWGTALLLPVSILAWAASAASVGLVCAMASNRIDRAIAAAVAIYAIVAGIWPVVWIWASGDCSLNRWTWTTISPFYSGFFLCYGAGEPEEYAGIVPACVVGAELHGVVALAGFSAATALFDRALGRTPDQARGPKTQRPSNIVAETGASPSRIRR